MDTVPLSDAADEFVPGRGIRPVMRDQRFAMDADPGSAVRCNRSGLVPGWPKFSEVRSESGAVPQW
ncbi:MAG: hypothetical protein ABSE98_09265 [Acidimicrobiales bacterium]